MQNNNGRKEWRKSQFSNHPYPEQKMFPSHDDNARKSRDEAATALIHDYQAGDAQAFNRLLDGRRYWQYIFKGLRAKGVPEAQAEDYTQQICVRLMKGLKEFRFDCTFENFLNAIIVRQAINFYRSRNKKVNGDRIKLHSLEELLATAENEKTPAFDLPDLNAPPPDAGLLYHDVRRIIAACLSLFTNKTAKLVTCLWLKGLKQRHVMALLEIPFGTVGSHLERGKNRLRHCVQKNYRASLTIV